MKKSIFFPSIRPPSGPAAVTDLSVKVNGTNSLSFHWSPPEGGFESYEFFLYRGDASLQERRRGQSSSKQCSFQGLMPGARYRMEVVTHSGEQNNKSSVWARTGEGRGRGLPRTNGSKSQLLRRSELIPASCPQSRRLSAL